MTRIKSLIQKYGASTFIFIASMSVSLLSFQPFWHNETRLPNSLMKKLK